MYQSISMTALVMQTNNIFIFFIFLIGASNMIELTIDSTNVSIFYDVDVRRGLVKITCFDDAVEYLGYSPICKLYAVYLSFMITVYSTNAKIRNKVAEHIFNNITNTISKYLNNVCNNRCNIKINNTMYYDTDSANVNIDIVFYGFRSAKDVIDVYNDVIRIMDNNANNIISNIVQRFSSS